jgi:assimilatory nitrate reductase catalytic subunit
MELLRRCGAPEGVRALLVFGSNLLVSAPGVTDIADRLAALDLLVVADPFLSETAAIADVVLPVTQWAEEEGTMTNLEGRVLLRRRMVAPAPGVRSDTEILAQLAQRLGCGAQFPADPRAIFTELRAASAGGVADYAGITWERIAAEDGVFWPCPDAAHPGTQRLFLERFATASGRARFHRVDHAGAAEATDETYPLILTTGRVMAQYQSGTQTRRVPSLNEAEPEAFCEMHADLAASLRIADGAPVRLTSRRGSARMRARLSRTIRFDVVFVPFHWGGEGCANRLTSQHTDPVSGIPEFKVCAVRVEPDPDPPPHAAGHGIGTDRHDLRKPVAALDKD